MDVLYGQRTSFPKGSSLRNEWIVVDGKEQITGRLASRVVSRLLGKHLPNYTPGFLLGDSVIIINADQIQFTGSKSEQKEYIWHTGFRGGLKSRKLTQTPKEKALLYAIRGMLPKTKYGRQLLRRVRIFPKAEHNMQAQNPEIIQF